MGTLFEKRYRFCNSMPEIISSQQDLVTNDH